MYEVKTNLALIPQGSNLGLALKKTNNVRVMKDKTDIIMYAIYVCCSHGAQNYMVLSISTLIESDCGTKMLIWGK